MKTLKIVAIAALAFVSSMTASANTLDGAGELTLRARAANLNWLQAGTAVNDLSRGNRALPEISLSYAFNHAVSIEASFTAPRRIDVVSDDKYKEEFGTVRQTSMNLLAQYHFKNSSKFEPYAGVGVNYSYFSGADLTRNVAATLLMKPHVDRDTFSPVFQLGIDYKLSDSVVLNADIKRARVRGKVNTSTAVPLSSSFSADPALLSLGVGYRF